jgi:hypothetical protein
LVRKISQYFAKFHKLRWISLWEISQNFAKKIISRITKKIFREISSTTLVQVPSYAFIVQYEPTLLCNERNVLVLVRDWRFRILRIRI